MNDWSAIVKLPAPLRTQVVAKLRNAIIEGVFKPGDRLVERVIADRLQVSRPSVREAVRQLEAERLVEVIPDRGPVVCALSLQEVDDLHDLRAAAESLCARYFAERGTDAEIALFRERVTELEQAAQSGVREALIIAKRNYYEAFLQGCHSSMLQSYVQQLNARVSYLWSSALSKPGRVAEGAAEMRSILLAIEAHDPERAEQASRIHVEHGRATIRSVFERQVTQNNNRKLK
jgi:DNA-binding GntR family transcriptional regulator